MNAGNTCDEHPNAKIRSLKEEGRTTAIIEAQKAGLTTSSGSSMALAASMAGINGTHKPNIHNAQSQHHHQLPTPPAAAVSSDLHLGRMGWASLFAAFGSSGTNQQQAHVAPQAAASHAYLMSSLSHHPAGLREVPNIQQVMQASAAADGASAVSSPVLAHHLLPAGRTAHAATLLTHEQEVPEHKRQRRGHDADVSNLATLGSLLCMSGAAEGDTKAAADAETAAAGATAAAVVTASAAAEAAAADGSDERTTHHGPQLLLLENKPASLDPTDAAHKAESVDAADAAEAAVDAAGAADAVDLHMAPQHPFHDEIRAVMMAQEAAFRSQVSELYWLLEQQQRIVSFAATKGQDDTADGRPSAASRRDKAADVIMEPADMACAAATMGTGAAQAICGLNLASTEDKKTTVSAAKQRVRRFDLMVTPEAEEEDDVDGDDGDDDDDDVVILEAGGATTGNLKVQNTVRSSHVSPNRAHEPAGADMAAPRNDMSPKSADEAVVEESLMRGRSQTTRSTNGGAVTSTSAMSSSQKKRNKGGPEEKVTYDEVDSHRGKRRVAHPRDGRLERKKAKEALVVVHHPRQHHDGLHAAAGSTKAVAGSLKDERNNNRHHHVPSKQQHHAPIGEKAGALQQNAKQQRAKERAKQHQGASRQSWSHLNDIAVEANKAAAAAAKARKGSSNQRCNSKEVPLGGSASAAATAAATAAAAHHFSNATQAAINSNRAAELAAAVATATAATWQNSTAAATAAAMMSMSQAAAAAAHAAQFGGYGSSVMAMGNHLSCVQQPSPSAAAASPAMMMAAAQQQSFVLPSTAAMPPPAASPFHSMQASPAAAMNMTPWQFQPPPFSYMMPNTAPKLQGMGLTSPIGQQKLWFGYPFPSFWFGGQDPRLVSGFGSASGPPAKPEFRTPPPLVLMRDDVSKQQRLVPRESLKGRPEEGSSHATGSIAATGTGTATADGKVARMDTGAVAGDGNASVAIDALNLQQLQQQQQQRSRHFEQQQQQSGRGLPAISKEAAKKQQRGKKTNGQARGGTEIHLSNRSVKGDQEHGILSPRQKAKQEQTKNDFGEVAGAAEVGKQPRQQQQGEECRIFRPQALKVNAVHGQHPFIFN